MNVNSEGSKSESTSLPATLALSLESLISLLVRRSGGVRGVNEYNLRKQPSVLECNGVKVHGKRTYPVYRKYNIARYVAYDVSETLTTLLFIVVAVRAPSEDLMEDSAGVIIPEGGGLGEVMSSSPSSKSSSVISLPNPPGPMGIDPRSSSMDVTFRTSLKADLLANTGDKER